MGLNIEDLREQAESGSHVAQCLLGVCYLDGTDVAVDYKQAFATEYENRVGDCEEIREAKAYLATEN